VTASTRTPAQAAGAGGQGRPPASPRKVCGATNRQGKVCGLGRGSGTDHPGVGRCKHHGGSTPAGRKFAQRQQLAATLEALAIPAEGDPLEVLQAAVEAAHGVLLASRELVKVGANDMKIKLYLDGIERAARVAKSAAEAINLEELVRIREREADLLEAALMRTLERSGMGTRKRADFLDAFREELRAALPTAAELS
jgi:hypothetical protein